MADDPTYGSENIEAEDPSNSEQSFESPESVGELAELYLGNILYALELAALALEDHGRKEDAPFYRGIARKLAEARGRPRGG